MASDPWSDIVRGRLRKVCVFLSFEQVIKFHNLYHKIMEYLSRKPHIRTLLRVSFEISEYLVVSWGGSGRGKFGEIGFSTISKGWASLGFEDWRKVVILVGRYGSELIGRYWMEWLNLSDLGKLNCILDFDLFNWFCSIYSTGFYKNAFFDVILLLALESLFSGFLTSIFADWFSKHWSIKLSRFNFLIKSILITFSIAIFIIFLFCSFQTD